MNVSVENRLAVVIMLVAISGIALSAATISDVETYGGDAGINVDIEGAEGSPEGNNPGEIDNGNGSDPGFEKSGVTLTTCIEVLNTPVGISAVVFLIVVVLYAIYRRFNAASSVFASFAVTPLVVGIWAFLTNCRSGGGAGQGGLSGSGLVSNVESGAVSAPPLPPWLIGVVFVSLMIVSVAVLSKASGQDQQFQPAEETEPDDPDTAEFARAARRAADRIEESNVPVDNAVYEAWLEMTGLLDIPNPETAAPMDFADTAIEVGLASDDVHELTELFNEVRYGHRDPETREERALNILRHIEETYEERPSDRSNSGDYSSGGEN